MSDYEKPPNHFEITAIISICALLFSAALRDLGHLSWAVPAMTFSCFFYIFPSSPPSSP